MFLKIIIILSKYTAITLDSLVATTNGLETASKPASEYTRQEIELSKFNANLVAIKERTFQGEMVIGIGSGSTVVHGVKFIAEAIQAVEKKAAEEGRRSNLNVTCIPSSFQAQQLIVEHKLRLGSLDSHPRIDWTIDGADEIDAQNNLIKGGGGCHTQEKMLAAASKELFIVADPTKVSSKLGTAWKKGIPVEVMPLNYVHVKELIEKRLGGEAVLRMAVAKAGPVITDHGNFILDWKFPASVENWKEVQSTIKMITGVVDIGLFLDMATKVYVGYPNNKVTVYAKQSTEVVSSVVDIQAYNM